MVHSTLVTCLAPRGHIRQTSRDQRSDDCNAGARHCCYPLIHAEHARAQDRLSASALQIPARSQPRASLPLGTERALCASWQHAPTAADALERSDSTSADERQMTVRRQLRHPHRRAGSHDGMTFQCAPTRDANFCGACCMRTRTRADEMHWLIPAPARAQVGRDPGLAAASSLPSPHGSGPPGPSLVPQTQHPLVARPPGAAMSLCPGDLSQCALFGNPTNITASL